MKIFRGIDDITAAVGSVLGTSEWITVDQERIDGFAESTGDHQWIHVDPERAARGPYGGTIAHGYLTLSLLPAMLTRIYRVEGARMAVNYGLNRVRFVSPVPVNSRLRGTAALLEAKPLPDNAIAMTLRTTVEIDGAERPACVAESVGRQYF